MRQYDEGMSQSELVNLVLPASLPLVRDRICCYSGRIVAAAVLCSVNSCCGNKASIHPSAVQCMLAALRPVQLCRQQLSAI